MGTANVYTAMGDGSVIGLCKDPLYMYYSFMPREGEECVYTICFQGYDSVNVPDGIPNDPTLDTLEASDIRCFKIEVYNNVLEFDGNAGALDVEVSRNLLPQEGFSMTVWAMPVCQDSPRNMTIAYLGSVRDFEPTEACPVRRDEGNEVRNALRYLDLGNGTGRFFYYDVYVGAKMTERTFCCGKWHHVGVSIQPNNTAYLFVDGVREDMQLHGSMDVLQYEVVEFETASRPDHRQDTDEQLTVDGVLVQSSGYLAVGYYPEQAFVGYVDDLRLWSRYLTREEAAQQMYSRMLEPPEDPHLIGRYTMGDGRPATHGNYGVNTGYMQVPVPQQDSLHSWSYRDALANYGNGPEYAWTLHPWPDLPSQPAIMHRAIPSQIPCVLGMQHVVGPVDGLCVTDVYGWSMADGPNPKCRFDGIETPATWVSDDVFRCETPGHFTPRYVVVHASNNGTRFSDPEDADKTVHHLFLESSLFVQGSSGGAEADSVCLDLPKRAMSFGAWTCPKCGPPPIDIPPPPAPPPPPPPPQSPPPPEENFGGR